MSNRSTPAHPTVNVEVLAASAAEDKALVDELVTLINEAYATSEAGFWTDGAARTSSAEITELIRTGQIAVALADDQLIGAVRIQQLDDVTGEFGMLVTSARARGTGAGRELVAFAERWAAQRGLTVIQLEALFPRDWAHPSKEFLRSWYTRLGYVSVRTERFEESFPQLAPQLATACDFVIFHKPLVASNASPNATDTSRLPLNHE